MAQPARRLRPEDMRDADKPSLDPAAIERSYLRERARRRAVTERRSAVRNSHARFFVVLAVLMLLTVLITLTAWHQIETTFGI